jgi:ferredoxin
MAEGKVYMFPNPSTPCQAVVIDPELCSGCNRCVEVCRTADCPVPGAIKMERPLNQRVGWKRKETGEYFRIGMLNPPPPNTRPPVG